MRRSAIAFTSAVLICALVLCGCSAPKSEPAASQTDPAEEFARLTTEGDAAWVAGDAEAAYYRYTEALETTGAVDAGGMVAGKQELAKHTFIARNLLDDFSGNTWAFDPLIAILTEHSVAATESVEARSQIIESIARSSQSMRDEWIPFRQTIEAEQSARLPVGTYVNCSLSEAVLSDIENLEGPFGQDVVTAMQFIERAANEAALCMEREWVEDAVADLETGEATLDELSAHLDKMRATDYAATP